MNAQQVEQEIRKLDLGIVESKADRVDAAIAEAAQAVADAGLFLAKGSSSPSSKTSFQRLYLQRAQGTSHNSRTQDYRDNVIDVWEWQTSGGGYRRQISARAIVDACKSIARKARQG